MDIVPDAGSSSSEDSYTKHLSVSSREHYKIRRLDKNGLRVERFSVSNRAAANIISDLQICCDHRVVRRVTYK